MNLAIYLQWLLLSGSEGVFKQIDHDGKEQYYYNGIEILPEEGLIDYLLEKDASGEIKSVPYKYIKINGTKYYLDETKGCVFYINGTERVKQASESVDANVYKQYEEKIKSNTSGISYYKSAWDFHKWLDDNGLLDLTLGDAVTEVELSGDSSDKIFANAGIEYYSSNFNSHRREVIKHSIETNLSVAIANFNSYTQSVNNFQMPKLKDNEWELLQNEVSIISFLQGLNIGGKIYNGYTVVTNSKTEEVVKEESVYITSKDGYYHKITDKHLLKSTFALQAVSGVLHLDFEIRKDAATGGEYIQKEGLGCYTSIVGQENNNNYESIYEYLKDSSMDDTIKQKYYTALGRERWSGFKIVTTAEVHKIITSATPGVDEVVRPEIGAYVTNYEPVSVSNEKLGIGGWRIFDIDEKGYVYLIADEYISPKFVPTGIGEYEIENARQPKSFKMTNILPKYEGRTNAEKAVNYLLNKSTWSMFINSEYASSAAGAPTLEQFVSSYNKTHVDKQINLQKSGNGYNLKWKEQSDAYYDKVLNGVEPVDEISNKTYGATFKNLSGNTAPGLYRIGSKSASALGYWIATPDSNRTSYVRRIYYEGTINAGEVKTEPDDGVRPIVCLKYSVKFEKQGNGTYMLIKD